MNLSLPISPLRFQRIAVSIYFFIAGLTFASWACRIPDIKNKLHLSDAGLGSVLLSLPIGLMASLPLSGWLVGKFGSRKVLLIASVAYPVLLLFIGLAQTTFTTVIALFFFGMFANLFNISVNTQGVGVELQYQRSIMASFHGVWSLAGFSGALIGTLMISFQICTLYHFITIAILCILLGFFAYKHTLKQDSGKKNQPIFAVPDKGLLLLGLIAFCCMVCEGTMFDWSGVYFDKVIKAPINNITLGYTAFMFSMASGRFVGDWLTTKLGGKLMLQMSGVLVATGLMLAVSFPNIIVATFGFLLVGLGVSTVVPLVYSAAGKSSNMTPGAALAAVSTIGFVGFLFGPPAIGFIAEASNLRWSFTLIAVLGFSITLLAAKTTIK